MVTRIGPIVLASLLAACSLLAPKLVRPTVSVASIQLVGGNLLQQEFLVKFAVDNPNDRSLPVSGLHAEISVMGERVASGVSNHAFVVPALGTGEFEVTFTANAALALLKLAQRHDQPLDAIDYEMSGGASIDMPFMHELPFHQSGSLSLK